MPETPQLNECQSADTVEQDHPPATEECATGPSASDSSPAESSEPKRSVSPLSSKLRNALSVLFLGLRTAVTAALAAWRQPPADADNVSSASDLLHDARQQTLEASLSRAQADIQALRAELKSTVRLLHEREHDIGDLQSHMRASVDAAAGTEAQLRAALERAQETIRTSDAENAQLSTQVAQLSAELDQQRSALQASQSRLAEVEAEGVRQRTEAVLGQQAAVETAQQEASRSYEELRRKFDEASQAAQQTAAGNAELQRRVADLENQISALTEVGQKLTTAEKELAEKVGEADLLRADLLAQRRKLTELDSQLREFRDRAKVQEDFQRDLQRNATQLDILNEELARFRARAEKLEITIREFYLQAVDPITVAAAAADLAASSTQLSASDRENVAAIREKLDKFLELMKRLVREMNELGIVTGSKN